MYIYQYRGDDWNDLDQAGARPAKVTMVELPFPLQDDGWAAPASPAGVAYGAAVETSGVYPLRDQVDTQSLQLVKRSIHVPIDGPGGCCVKSGGCSTGVHMPGWDYDAKLDQCKMTSCAPGVFNGSERCDIGTGPTIGLNEVMFGELNAGLPQRQGVSFHFMSHIILLFRTNSKGVGVKGVLSFCT